MKKHAVLLAMLLALAVVPQFAQAETLMMATTTSTDNTGLLDVLAPVFQEETGIELQWTAVGTGKALEMGRNCDVDVLLVHAPGAEATFVEEGHGVNRTELMYNDFVIIGPASDPAGVQGLSVVEALTKIAESGTPFVSRGDNSGTNKKELSLWKAAGLTPDAEEWYVQTGQGMIATITVTEEEQGYTMTDRGTYIKYEANSEGNPALVVLVEGDEILFNQYSALAVNPDKCPDVKFDLANTFIEWMASPSTQQRIADFRLLDKQLFTPNAAK